MIKESGFQKKTATQSRAVFSLKQCFYIIAAACIVSTRLSIVVLSFIANLFPFSFVSFAGCKFLVGKRVG